jgi:hypothetical protein
VAGSKSDDVVWSVGDIAENSERQRDNRRIQGICRKQKSECSRCGRKHSWWKVDVSLIFYSPDVEHDFSSALSLYSRSDAVLAEVMNGIVLYFDKALGNNLLYRFERAQYLDIRRKTGELKPMSEVYGAEHLLRLIGKYNVIILPVDMSLDRTCLSQSIYPRISLTLQWIPSQST